AIKSDHYDGPLRSGPFLGHGFAADDDSPVIGLQRFRYLRRVRLVSWTVSHHDVADNIGGRFNALRLQRLYRSGAKREAREQGQYKLRCLFHFPVPFHRQVHELAISCQLGGLLRLCRHVATPPLPAAVRLRVARSAIRAPPDARGTFRAIRSSAAFRSRCTAGYRRTPRRPASTISRSCPKGSRGYPACPAHVRVSVARSGSKSAVDVVA